MVGDKERAETAFQGALDAFAAAAKCISGRGWAGVAACFIVFSYLSVIAGWMLAYVVRADEDLEPAVRHLLGESQRDELARRRVPVVLGPISHPWVSGEEIPDREEYVAPDEHRAARLHDAGVTVAIASFSRSFGSLGPAGSGKWLLLDAALAAGYGMSEDDVLRAITLAPAEILGVADRVGSLEPGKDGDVIIVDGPPLSVLSWVERVFADGVEVFVRPTADGTGQ